MRRLAALTAFAALLLAGCGGGDDHPTPAQQARQACGGPENVKSLNNGDYWRDIEVECR